MKESEISAWQLNDVFGAGEVAALIMGCSPHESTDGQLEPVLRRMRSDYKLAIRAHLDIINPVGDDWESEYTSIPNGALQSQAMLAMTNADTPEFNPHRVWQWLIGRSVPESHWPRSEFDEQHFHRVEIVRWLATNGISSAFQFDSSSRDSAEHPNGDRAHVSDKLAYLNQAARKFWADQNKTTRSSHPTNELVESWLKEHGFSAKQAEAAAGIIRPSWAPPGRKPKE